IEIFGNDLSLQNQAVNGLVFQAGADGSKVYGLTVDNFRSGIGIVADSVANVQLGASNGMLNSSGNAIANGQGENVLYKNWYAIDITGTGSTNDSMFASFIGTDRNSTANIGNSNGVEIEQGASGNNIGPGRLGNGDVG